MDEILDDLEQSAQKKKFEHASKTQRFLNYLIDVFFYYIFIVLFSFIIAFFLTISEDSEFVFQFMAIILLVAYYTFLEYFNKGKTIGKYITKTRAITKSNGQLSLKDAFTRSLCRLIPFEAFSFLGKIGKGWHDSITDTKVIKDNGWK